MHIAAPTLSYIHNVGYLVYYTVQYFVYYTVLDKCGQPERQTSKSRSSRGERGTQTDILVQRKRHDFTATNCSHILLARNLVFPLCPVYTRLPFSLISLSFSHSLHALCPLRPTENFPCTERECWSSDKCNRGGTVFKQVLFSPVMLAWFITALVYWRNFGRCHETRTQNGLSKN